MLLENKVALVTGAGSGIGRETSRVMAREGAAVVVSDVDEQGGQDTVDLIKGAGGEATFVRTDVTDEAQVRALVAAAVQTYGTLDCAHNNAGIGGPLTDLASYPLDGFDAVYRVNIRGVLASMQAELAHMLPLGKGAIVNTASTFGLVAFPNAPGYVASKHAVIGLTKAAAIENAARGVRVNAVCPGAIRTAMVQGQAEELGGDNPGAIYDMLASLTPMGRLGDPHEIGEAVAWLLSDRASYTTGAALTVDGGWTAQ